MSEFVRYEDQLKKLMIDVLLKSGVPIYAKEKVVDTILTSFYVTPRKPNLVYEVKPLKPLRGFFFLASMVKDGTCTISLDNGQELTGLKPDTRYELAHSYSGSQWVALELVDDPQSPWGMRRAHKEDEWIPPNKPMLTIKTPRAVTFATLPNSELATITSISDVADTHPINDGGCSVRSEPEYLAAKELVDEYMNSHHPNKGIREHLERCPTFGKPNVRYQGNGYQACGCCVCRGCVFCEKWYEAEIARVMKVICKHQKGNQ